MKTTLENDVVLLVGPRITIAASIDKSLSRVNARNLTRMAALILPAGEYPTPKKDRFGLFNPVTVIDDSNVDEVLNYVWPSRSTI